MKPQIHVAANGHLSLGFTAIPKYRWTAFVDRLVRDYDFQRVGSTVTGLGEEINPSLQLAEFTLAVGWDTWSGHYLLSESDSGDAFLRRLCEEGEW